MSARVIIIDDDREYSRALKRHLLRNGHEVDCCEDLASAQKRLPAFNPDVVVLDQALPDGSGVDSLPTLRPLVGGAEFVVVTAYPSVDFAVTAVRAGAFDYMDKSTEMRECLMRIERARDVSSLKRQVVEAQSEPAESEEDMGMIGQSQAMSALRMKLTALAASDDTTALITGETGTGKGLVARAIYRHSRREFQPFVAVDCATIPPSLIESELFGYERGAFSGAVGAKPGRVENSGSGTLFLDEIGELELPVQTKLLRLLEEREYTRVGGTKPRKLNARIIAATNRNLNRAVGEGRFRADLRYRLEVFVLELPPLRDRAEDVFLIAKHYANERARALGRPVPGFSPDLKEALLRYPFPGNVRELRNMVEQAILLAPSDPEPAEELTTTEFPVLAQHADGAWLPSQPPPLSPSPGSGFGGPGIEDQGARRDQRSDHALSPRPWSVQAGPPPVVVAGELVHEGAVVDAPAGTGALDLERIVTRRSSDEAPSLDTIRRQHEAQERDTLLQTLHDTGGNVSETARRMSLSRHQVMRRMRKYDLR